MLATIESDQDDRTAYPTEGVRIGINYHDQTLGKFRPRFFFDRPVAEILRRGLSYPRVHIDGTFVNGLRIWCTDQDGMNPTVSKAGSWSLSLPVRRVRGREDHVATQEVSFIWERDETGPVIIIPRMPDALLPEPVIDKLPNSQVDQSTIMERAEKRLEREMTKMFAEAPEVTEAEPPSATEPENPWGVSTVEPPPPVIPAAVVEPPSSPAVDLKTALAMVNELVDQLGDQVVLSIDANGHVTAKRRIVSYIDL